MKKYPVYNEDQNNDWNNLFSNEVVYDSFEYITFSKLYHKGYQVFSNRETVYKEIADKISLLLPSIPFTVKNIDSTSIEIEIHC